MNSMHGIRGHNHLADVKAPAKKVKVQPKAKSKAKPKKKASKKK